MKTSNHLLNEIYKDYSREQEVEGGGKSIELHRAGAGESSASTITTTA